MVRLQKSLFVLLRIVLVLFAATLARTVSAETDHKPATGTPGTSVAAADTAQGSSTDGKDDSSDDDDDDDDGEEQQ